MNEEQAVKAIKTISQEVSICDDNSINIISPYVSYPFTIDLPNAVCLDGIFNADQLEALVWWMRNK